MSAARRLGRYELGEIIGSGGAAEVVRARIVGAGDFRKDVVIKRLRAELQGNVEAREGFVREAMLARKLHHGNVVQTLDLGDDDGTPYIVLELVEGCTLQRLVDQGPIPLAVALHVAEQIAIALQYVHEAKDDAGLPLGLVHRDVKPSNVLLGKGGIVKLADFGIARAAAFGADTLPGFIKGTALYLAPEQAAGRPIDARVDVYALGLVLRRMLVGDGPMDDVDPDLAAIVTAATEPAVRDRLVSAEEMLTRLQRYRATRDVGSGTAALAALVDRVCGAKPPRVIAIDRALADADPARTRQVAPMSMGPARTPRRWPWIAGTLAVAAIVAIVWPRAPEPEPSPITVAPEPDAEPAPAPTPAPAPDPTTAPVPGNTLVAPAPVTPPTRVTKPRGSGRVKVNLSPYAEVTLDGRSLGETPIDEPLRAGEHRLELYNPDSGLRRTLEITIKDGQTHNITRW